MNILACLAAVLSLLQEEPPDPFKGLWKPIDLTLRRVDAAGALARLSDEAGEPVKIRGAAPAPRKITIRLRKATFWSALDEICRRQGNLRHPELWRGVKEQAVIAGAWVERPVWYRGPFRLTVADIARVREIRGAERLDRTEIVLMLQWIQSFAIVRDRRFRPGTLRLTRVEDDTGKSLLPPLELEREFTHSPTRWSALPLAPWQFRLKPVSTRAKTIKVLEGVWEGGFLTESHTVTFENPLAKPDAVKEIGPLRVAIHNFRLDAKFGRNTYRYKVLLSYDRRTAPKDWMESLKSVPLQDRLQQEARTGAQGMNLLTKARNYGPEDTVAEYNGILRPLKGPPDSVTVRVAGAVGTARVPFSIDKVPLPEKLR